MRHPGWWPVLAAWALLGLALLAAAGLLAVFVVLGGACWLLLAASWSIVRQQLAPSRYCRPALPRTLPGRRRLQPAAGRGGRRSRAGSRRVAVGAVDVAALLRPVG